MVINPHQWSFAKQSVSKIDSDGLKVQIPAEAKRDCVKTQQNNNFNQF